MITTVVEVDEQWKLNIWQVIIVNTGKTSRLSTLDFAIQKMFAKDDIIVDIAYSSRPQTKTCHLLDLVILPVISMCNSY